MKLQRSVGALLLAAGLVGFFCVSDAEGFPRRRVYVSPGPAVTNYAIPVYPYVSPYVAPLPAYGILPPPLATYHMLYGSGYLGDSPARIVPETGVRDPYEAPPRKRPSVYPAVPFGEVVEARGADLRRVRYEITVPFEHCTVLIDGVKTSQTGLRRVFVTPPLEEDKQYQVTITVQWTDDGGETRIRRKDFTVVAGETVKYTFIV